MHSLLFALLFSLCAFANPAPIHFKVVPGKFHAGGKAVAQIQSTDNAKNTMVVKLDYEVVKRFGVPVPNEFLKGTDSRELPLEFIDERGYLNLEAKGPKDMDEAVVYHMGRVTVGKYSNGHHVKIVAKNGKSETEVFYHPHLPELGWGKVKLTVHTPIPFLKSYILEAVLID